MTDAAVTREDVLAALDLLLAQGFGELTVKVHEHKIEQIDTLIRKRKACRAGAGLKQA